MKNNTHGFSDPSGCIPQPIQLSFYEENYILEPEDFEKDNGYFEFEGDISTDFYPGFGFEN